MCVLFAPTEVALDSVLTLTIQGMVADSHLTICILPPLGGGVQAMGHATGL